MTDEFMRESNECIEQTIRLAAAQEGPLWRKLQVNLETLLFSDPQRVWRPEGELVAILRELGAPCSLRGYRYAIRAVLLAVEDRVLLENLSQELYPEVAREFGAAAMRVERCIRTFVEAIWTRGDPEGRQKYFANLVDAQRGKPTNAEFIGILSDTVRSRIWDGTSVYAK